MGEEVEELLSSADDQVDTAGMSFAAEERPLLPIACTLGPVDGATRLEEWRRLSASAGLGHHPAPGRVTIRFVDAPGVEEELQRLVGAERDCCEFLGWEVAYAQGEWHVEISGTDEELRTLPFTL